jgi:hypothetical protein
VTRPWRNKNDELHVLDPFLLFYLAFGSWAVEKEILDEPEQEELPPATGAATS